MSSTSSSSRKQQQLLQQRQQKILQDTCHSLLQLRRSGDFDSSSAAALLDTLVECSSSSSMTTTSTAGTASSSAAGGTSHDYENFGLLLQHLIRVVRIEIEFEKKRRALRNTRNAEARAADWRLAIVEHMWPHLVAHTVADIDQLDVLASGPEKGGSGVRHPMMDHLEQHLDSVVGHLDSVGLFWRAKLVYEYCRGLVDQNGGSDGHPAMAALRHALQLCNMCMDKAKEAIQHQQHQLIALEPWVAIPTLCAVLKARVYALMGEHEHALDTYRTLYESLLNVGAGGTEGANKFVQCDSLVMIAAQRALLYYPEKLLEMSNVEECIKALRNVFNKGLILHFEVQFRLLKLLGSVLLHDGNAMRYIPLEYASEQQQQQQQQQQQLRSRKYSRRLSAVAAPQQSRIPVPQNATEEALLVLLVLQQLVESNNMVLNLTTLSKNEVAMLYDDICMVLSAEHQFQSLLFTYERGLSHFSDDPHFWNQYALALMNAKQYKRSLGVLEACMSLQPDSITPVLSAIKIYLNHLPHTTDNLGECMKLAQSALKLAKSKNPFLQHRCHHAIGLVYGAMSRRASSRTEQQTYQNNALDHLMKSHKMDSQDHVVCFHLALQYAEIRDIPKAFFYVKRSIELHRFFVDAWILLTLLFTCTDDYGSAINTVRVARKEYPNNIHLMALYARLEEAVEGERKSLVTYSKLRDYIANVYLGGLFRSREDEEGNDDDDAEHNAVGTADQNQRRARRGISSAAPRRAAESSPDLSRERITQFKLLSNRCKLEKRRDKAAKSYLLIADAFRRSSVFDEARNTVNMAQDLLKLAAMAIAESGNHSAAAAAARAASVTGASPTAPDMLAPVQTTNCEAQIQNSLRGNDTEANSNIADVHFCEGQINESTKRIDEAVSEYKRALLLNSDHKDALLHLGIIYSQQKKNAVARSYLQQALRVDPSHYHAWHQLGIVLKESGDYMEASDCLFTALQLEKSSPLLPFDMFLRWKLF